MSEKSGKKKIVLDDNSTGFEKFSRDFKFSIFGVLFVLLKDDEEDLLFLYVSTFLDYAQMQYFPFSESVNSVWNATDFLSNIFTFFNFFQLTQYLKILI